MALRIKYLYKISLILFLSSFLGVFPLSSQSFRLNDSISTDPNIIKGKLDNGLTYYIRSNPKPENRLEMRLVVNAGSLLESENQLGIAHFMEHMNFNGLEHFPKNELTDFLRDIGVRFGADLNANTGFDRTLYILPIPIEDKENITKGFQILADWAGGALISDEEVNKERKVIAEELRLRGKNAAERMQKQYLPQLLNHARYAYRLPGGKENIVMQVSPDTIRQFYKDWYRPDNMAVIIVGDLSKENIEKNIKRYFSNLKGPTHKRKRDYFKIPPYQEQSVQIVTDDEATGYGFSLILPAKEKFKITSVADYKEALIRNIFVQALNRKLHKKSQKQNSPFLGASASMSGILGNLTLDNESFSLTLTPNENFTDAINASIEEILRIDKYGFKDKDIEREKKKIKAAYEKSYNERNKTLSKAYINGYIQNFMTGNPIPGIENTLTYINTFLGDITTEDINRLATKILSETNNFYGLITGPKQGDLNLPNESELLKIIKESFQQKVTEDTVSKTHISLLNKVPIPGKIISETKNDILGTTTYLLGNGVKVTSKYTDFKDDQILFKGIKYGGSGLYDAQDKMNTTYLTSAITTMGFGDFSLDDLTDFISGKNVSMSLNFGSISNTINGSSSVKDFETLLKLNYLELTSPRKDEELLNGFLKKISRNSKYAKEDPQTAFIDSLYKTIYNNNPLAPIIIPNEEQVKSINAERLLEIYKEQFSNADGFHFFIVGNIDPATIENLIEKYLGSLPTEGTKPKYRDNKLRMVDGQNTFKFYKGKEDKSLILKQYYGDNIKYSPQKALEVKLLSNIMTIQINDTIREKMEAIYSGAADGALSKEPYNQYNLTIQLPGNPKNVDLILEEINKEIKGLLSKKWPKENLKKAQKALLKEHKENLTKNGYWLNNLVNLIFWKRDQDFFLNWENNINKVQEKDIDNIAREIFNNNHFNAILYPENR